MNSVGLVRASSFCLFVVSVFACASHPSEAARSVPSAAPPTTAAVPVAPYVPKATFRSAQTGSVALDGISGNSAPCTTTRLYIGLADPADAKRFSPFIGTDRTIPNATIDDPTGGHNVYTLRGVAVTGKSIRSGDGPRLTLNFSYMSMTWCEHASQH